MRKDQAYITKRILLSASSKAVKAASLKAMRIAGHVVRVKDGWVVREHQDGAIERISRLGPKVKPQEVVLD